MSSRKSVGTEVGRRPNTLSPPGGNSKRQDITAKGRRLKNKQWSGATVRRGATRLLAGRVNMKTKGAK